MTLDEQKEKIASLDEKEFREKLLIPLFSKMGFIDPILHHHSNEKGKDIVMKEYDSKFKTTNYIAVVVKAGDVNGSSSSSSSYFTLINQVKQSINEPYKHIYELKEVSIDQVIIVISGKFLPTSLESIYGTLKSERLDKAIKESIDINKIIDLIEDFFPEYWTEFENEHNSLINQRNNLLNNFSKLSKVLFPDHEEQEKFLNTISQKEYDINLLPFDSITKYVANIGYNKINIDEIDDFYTDEGISNDYCQIKSYFFDIKEKAKKVLYDIDDIVELLKSILNEKNPQKVVEISMELDSYVSGYGGSFSISTRDIERQEDFGYALNEYKTKKDILIENNLLGFYRHVIISINESSLSQIASFYKEFFNQDKDQWLGMSVCFDLAKKELIKINYYTFKKEPQILDKEKSFGFHRKEIESSVIIKTNEIKVELALNYFGFGLKEDEISPEIKAKKIYWHYSNGFEKRFFELLGYEIT